MNDIKAGIDDTAQPFDTADMMRAIRDGANDSPLIMGWMLSCKGDCEGKMTREDLVRLAYAALVSLEKSRQALSKALMRSPETSP